MSVWVPYTGPMANELTTEQQHELVYQGIVALAGHCDGAQAKDFQGFNGVDTHFGRRVAGVPREQWTPEVFDECCHIILKYREQVLAYTGIDVATLQVVLAAQDQGTNYTARDQARTYEKRAAALADRKIDAVTPREGRYAGQTVLGIFYGKKDPDFQALLATCKALPGRAFDWTLKANVVPPSPAIEDFVMEWDFPLTDAARDLLAAPRAVKYDVTLDASGRRVVIDTPYDPVLVEAVRSLPGRAWDAGNKVNTVNVTPQVTEFARRFNLNVHPDVIAACGKAAQALQAREADKLVAQDVATVMNRVSSVQRPEDLPEVFVQMFQNLGRS